MKREDLLKLLDLKAKPAAEKKAEITISESLTATAEVELESGDSVFNLDEWELAHGERMPETQLSTKENGDLFAAAFRQYPEVEFHCGDEQFQEFVTTLLSSPDFNVLHESTRSNVMASDMAARQFAEQFRALRKETECGEASDIACLRAVGQALREAQEEVDELENMQNAFGMGGDGAKDSTMDPEKVAQLFQKVRNNPQLRRICELAGRFRRIAQSKQRQKTSHGYDDMVGVEMGGDVSRLLPLEMAMLADEDFELDAMRRLVERQSMCREFRGVENQAKGPIIVCVDESGSMSGDKVANAKAFALAMAWVANHQGRWCGLVSYSGGTDGVILELPPGKWSQEKLADWLCHFYGGGTDMDVPLKELPEKYWNQLRAPRGKTDVILITDAICHVPDKMRDDFNGWKKREKVKCVSLVVGTGSPGGLESVSDQIHLVSTIDAANDDVQSCFTV